MRTRVLVVLLALAAGCDVTLPWASSPAAAGGGGGGGGGGDEAGTFSVEPASLQVSAPSGGAAPAMRTLTFQIALSRSTPQTRVYVAETFQGTAVASVERTGTGTYGVYFPAPGSASAPRTGSVTVTACFDVGCSRHLQGSPFVVPVTYTVQPGLDAAPSTLSAEWTRGTPVPALPPVSLSQAGVTGATATPVLSSPSGTGWLSATATALPGTSTVTLAPEGLAPGNHAALVTYASSAGGTRNVVVNLAVHEAPLAAEPAALTFTGVQGRPPPAAQEVALSSGGVTATYTVTVDTHGSGAWLAAPATVSPPRVLSLQPGTTALAAGTHTATITFRSSSGELRGSLEVSYTILDVELVDPDDRTLAVTAATVQADLAGSTPVDVDAGPPLEYTASSDASWLVLGAAGGTTGGSLAWHVDPAVLASTRHGDRKVATVTLATASPPLSTAFTVTVEDRLPEVHWVAPSVQPAGAAARVRLRGAGFAGLDLAALAPVDGITGASVERLGDTSLVVDLPAAPAGARRASIPNALGLTRRGAVLRHVDAAAWALQKVAQAGPKRAAVLDARRNAVFTVNAAQEAVVRFAERGGTWTPSVRALPGVRDLGLSPDGDVLVAVTRTQVRLLDPVTLADLDAFTPPGNPAYEGMSESGGLAVLNDGRVLLPGGTGWANALATFDLDDHAFGALAVDPGVGYLSLHAGPWAAVSRDGERVVIVQSASISPTPPALYADASEGTARAVPGDFGFFYHASLSDDGGRLLQDQFTVRDAGFGRVGQVGSPGPGGAMSPDGARAYVLEYVPDYKTAAVPARIHMYDATTVPVSGPSLPLLRSFDVPGHVSCNTLPYDEYGCQYRVHVVPSPDERTLFIVGQQGLLVVPIPPP